MRSKYNKLVGIGLVILFFPFLFGWLIIFITPLLYDMHPYTAVQDQSAKATAEYSKILISDTLKLKKDSLFLNSRVIERIPTPTQVQERSIGDLGTFGDSAGFWNAIFSALAMTFVVVTLIYQLRKDAKDDERARIAQFHEQCLAMLSMLSEIVAQLRISLKPVAPFSVNPGDGIPNAWNPSYNQGVYPETQQQSGYYSGNDISGRACFKYIYDERAEGRNIRDYIRLNMSVPSASQTEDLYRSIRKVTEEHFDHYFRTVYRILKFIKESDLGDIENKKQDDIRDLCADLLRAQLSTYELAILYYNGLYPKYRNTSKVIYEHFCLFDNLDPKLLILQSEKDYYDQVQTHHKNPNDYDNTIHYDCTAFTKRHEPIEQKGGFRNWLERGLSFCHMRWRRNNQVSVDSIFTDSERAVYNVLKSRSGEISTVRKLAHLSGVSESVLKETVKKFEDTIVKVETTPSGKRYTVLKGLNNR